MSRPSRYVWFGRPTLGGSISTDAINTPSKPRSKTAGLRELAVVFEDIPTYRRYKPGTGPPLAPITLLPVRDTTAYIREEFFVPPALSAGGKKRLLYIVGWTDLPAARLQIDAERIFDYVSPRAYEEWCAARAAERDEEERRIEEEENPTSEAQTPTPKAQRIPLRAPATAPPATNLPFQDFAATSHTSTPGSGVTPLIQSTTPWTISLAAAKNFANLTPSQPIRSIEQASSSTPKPALPKPATRDPTSPLKVSQSAPPATTAGSTQTVARTLPTQEEQDAPEEDNIYEVLRLEGVQERIVRGKRVRFFHVRWKGAWPPGQNPTWEPEANIPRSLIKKYLLAHPQPQQQGHKTGAMDKYLVPSWPHRKYSSVSEAFEGGNADDAAAGHGHEDSGEEAIEDGGAEEEDIGKEMMLVTDEPAQPAKPTLSW
ncbi:hypothetical protein LZ30DRAFT_689415 [Colletotrichum cereale]|nr:hypothetical protein LZ30DRAFT_689415 [Colletotrichum cereale]